MSRRGLRVFNAKKVSLIRPGLLQDRRPGRDYRSLTQANHAEGSPDESAALEEVRMLLLEDTESLVLIIFLLKSLIALGTYTRDSICTLQIHLCYKKDP